MFLSNWILCWFNISSSSPNILKLEANVSNRQFKQRCFVPGTVLATGETEVNQAATFFTFIGNTAERRWQSHIVLFISKL